MTPSRIDAALTVREILRRYPATISVINAFGIDSCCGGNVPLETVARRDDLDLDVIVTALEAAILVGAG